MLRRVLLGGPELIGQGLHVSLAETLKMIDETQSNRLTQRVEAGADEFHHRISQRPWTAPSGFDRHRAAGKAALGGPAVKPTRAKADRSRRRRSTTHATTDSELAIRTRFLIDDATNTRPEEVVEAALENSPGALAIASHDRALRERLRIDREVTPT